MTENTETRSERTTVRQFRHDARGSLVQARERLALRTDATREVYTLLNGTIEEIIRGRQGLSQEEQVERLTNAKGVAEENKGKIAEAVSAAKEQVLAQIEEWDTLFAEALDAAIATLEQGATFAGERDFEAHQAEKHRSQGFYGGTVSYDEDEDGEFQED